MFLPPAWLSRSARYRPSVALGHLSMPFSQAAASRTHPALTTKHPLLGCAIGDLRNTTMWKYQADLPRLGVPPIAETLTRYLEALEPLLSDAEMAHTRAAVAAFEADPESEVLQEELQRLAETSPSGWWLDGYWDTAYLEPRLPVPINVNPFFVFEPFARTAAADRPGPATAALLAHACGRFVQAVRSHQLPPDMERTTPLCMMQYLKLFGCARVPHIGRDKLVIAKSHHAVVMVKGHTYTLDVLDADGAPIPEAALLAQLQAIQDHANDRPAAPHVGLLTTAERDAWARARESMETAGGREALAKVDSALFVVCLDDNHPVSMLETSRRTLHADGTNRWFDKLQFIVDADGGLSLNMEHSPVDGHTVLHLAEDIAAYAGTSPAPSSLPEPSAMSPIDFPVSADVETAIAEARAAFTALIDTTESKVLLYDRFGKDFCKKAGVSPDGLVQVAYQAAYFRAFQTVDSTYESALTKRFMAGRTECVRSASSESAAFARALQAGTADRTLLDKAVKKHVERMSQCKNGLGVDRHLYGLLLVARNRKKSVSDIFYEVPELFHDPAFSRLMTSVVSTSNCGSPALRLFGFGPVVGNGLGIGYMIRDSSIHFNVTSFQNHAGTFCSALESTLGDLARILE